MSEILGRTVSDLHKNYYRTELVSVTVMSLPNELILLILEALDVPCLLRCKQVIIDHGSEQPSNTYLRFASSFDP